MGTIIGFIFHAIWIGALIYILFDGAKKISSEDSSKGAIGCWIAFIVVAGLIILAAIYG